MLSRLAVVVLIVGGWDRDAAADARVAVEAAEEMGFLSASHARITGSYGRRLLANRRFVELRLGAGSQHRPYQDIGNVLGIKLDGSTGNDDRAFLAAFGREPIGCRDTVRDATTGVCTCRQP